MGVLVGKMMDNSETKIFSGVLMMKSGKCEKFLQIHERHCESHEGRQTLGVHEGVRNLSLTPSHKDDIFCVIVDTLTQKAEDRLLGVCMYLNHKKYF